MQEAYSDAAGFLWEGPTIIEGRKSSWAPDFVRHAGRDYAVFCDSNDNGKLKLQPLFGPPGEQAITIAAGNDVARSKETPAACSVGNQLFVAWHRLGTRELWIAVSSDLAGWQCFQLSNSIKDETRPAMVLLTPPPGSDPRDVRVHLLWASYDPEALVHATFDPLSRFDRNTVAIKATPFDSQHSPSMTVMDHTIHAAWAGYHDGEPIFTSYLNRASWWIWTPQIRLSDSSKTDKGPGIAATDHTLFLFFRGADRQLNFMQRAGTNQWSAPEKLFQGRTDSHQDTIANFCFGSAVVGWNQDWQMKYAAVGKTPWDYLLGDGVAVKTKDNPAVFVVCGGAKFWVKSPTEFFQLGYTDWKEVLTISPSALNALATQPSDGSFIKEPTSDLVCAIVGGARLGVANPDELGKMIRGTSRRVVAVPTGTFAALPTIPRNGTVVALTDESGEYVVKEGKLHKLDHADPQGAVVAPMSILDVLPKNKR